MFLFSRILRYKLKYDLRDFFHNIEDKKKENGILKIQ